MSETKLTLEQQAKRYARVVVLPNYGEDEDILPTPYEHGLMKTLEAAFIAGAAALMATFPNNSVAVFENDGQHAEAPLTAETPAPSRPPEEATR